MDASFLKSRAYRVTIVSSKRLMSILPVSLNSTIILVTQGWEVDSVLTPTSIHTLNLEYSFEMAPVPTPLIPVAIVEIGSHNFMSRCPYWSPK